MKSTDKLTWVIVNNEKIINLRGWHQTRCRGPASSPLNWEEARPLPRPARGEQGPAEVSASDILTSALLLNIESLLLLSLILCRFFSVLVWSKQEKSDRGSDETKQSETKNVFS